jgi:hypothetical protein
VRFLRTHDDSQGFRQVTPEKHNVNALAGQQANAFPNADPEAMLTAF